MAKQTPYTPTEAELDAAFPATVFARGEFDTIHLVEGEPFSEFHCGSEYSDFADGDIVATYKLESIKRIKRTVATKAVDL